MEGPVWTSLWTTLHIIAGFWEFLVEKLEKTKKNTKLSQGKYTSVKEQTRA